MQRFFSHKILLPLMAVTLGAAACKKDFHNPNDANAEDVFQSERAVTGVATGIQKVYSTSAAGSLYAIVNANGFVTNELILLNQGNIGELQLVTGGSAVDATNNVLTNIWTNSNKVIFDADSVISYANKAADKTYAAGLISYVSIFKALALGNMGMFWEQVPDTIGVNVGFISRIDGFKKAIRVLDNAIAWYNSNTISTTFKQRVPAEVDIINTLYALKARYALYSGDYALALSAANSVDLTKKSVFAYNAQNFNPVYETATSPNNVFQPVDSTLGLPVAIAPDLADKRIPFYTRIAAAPRFRINGFYVSSTSQVPLYLPGEITLIKAEAYARQAAPDLAAALVELNKVVTKKPAEDPYGVGADLPPLAGLSQAQILEQIYRHRCIELFMSGLKLEDMRRFNRPQSERKRNFFPYPFRERDNNPNTPADPSF